MPATSSAPASPPLIVWSTLGLLAGQAVGPWIPPWIALACAVPALGAPLRSRRLRAPALALLAMAAGAVQVHRLIHPVLDPTHIAGAAGTLLELRGEVLTWTPIATLRQRMLIEADAMRRAGDWTAASGRVLITLDRTENDWQPGDRFDARLRLRRPRNFGNPGEFDYEAYLARRRVYVTAFAATDAGWERLPRAADTPLSWLDRWRSAVGRAIDATLTDSSAQIVAALLIGNMAGLDPALQARYARAGINHALSISGLHIGLVAAPAYAACRWALARSEWLLLRASVPKLAAAFTAIPVLLYAGIAGSNVATVRSVLMLLLVCAATLVNRPRDWIANVAAAALGISLVWPGAVAEISFQLSFVAVTSIILGMERCVAWWHDWEERHLIRLRAARWRWVRWLVLYHAATLCAVAGTAPLTAWHFNLVSLVAPLANAFIVPLLGFVPVGLGLLAAVAVPFAPMVAAHLLAVVGRFVAVADWLTAIAAGLPGAAVRVVTPSLIELVLLYGVIAAVILPRGTRRLVLCVCLSGLAVDATYWYVERFHGRDLRVTFLSVGHGDSAVIEFPGSVVMVIDGGGLSSTFDTGERLVAPYLWGRKIQRVDIVVVTHADFDHYGGLEFLVREFHPREVWWNGSPGAGSRFAHFWAAAQSAGARTVRVQSGQRRLIEGVEVRILNPPAVPGGSDNDRSVTLRLGYGPTALLFPGDIERDGEARLVADYGEALASTILKVPHHGSRTSSTPSFLGVIAPSLAVVSVGYEDRYHLPSPGVLAAYLRRHSLVLRTDEDGAITVRVGEGGHVRVRSHRQPTWSTVDVRPCA